MAIIIECSLNDLPRLFDSRFISSGVAENIPGGAKIQVSRMPTEKRSLRSVEPSLVLLELRWSSDSAVSPSHVSSWLYQRLKGDWNRRRMVRIDRELIDVTPEAITRVLERSIKTVKQDR
ncbi:MAG TPA: hypothetical protein VHR84_10295 [Terriglobales bacterium]|nr:hypothetical protein [Terriglobales bacterium]